MRIYPAFRFVTGGNEFFVTKMNASEIAETVNFASDLFQGKTLSEAIQRNLSTQRAAKDIAFYWRENEARFFNSIVIAAWQGNATFQPIESLMSGVAFIDTLLEKNNRMRDAFGILAFDGNEKYYALDGQHRVKAITLMQNDPANYPPPPGFKDDEFTVIIVPTAEGEDVDQFRQRYRRMFSALNRYAKPTDNATNIVMDEDDVFAIITRSLITDHPFFRWGLNEWENERVKTESGKNLTSGQSYFTQIEVLYEMTVSFLLSAPRANSELADLKTYKQVRPTESTIEQWYEEVALIWNTLTETITDLKADPARMRTHNPRDEDEETADHLWFWPIGQQMVAPVVRMLIDQSDPDMPLEAHAVAQALSVLGKISWDLHELPWRYLLLVADDNGVWRMRSEGRAQAMKVAKELLLWTTGVLELGEAGVNDLRDRWEFNLYQEAEDLDDMWSKIEEIRILAVGSDF